MGKGSSQLRMRNPRNPNTQSSLHRIARRLRTSVRRAMGNDDDENTAGELYKHSILISGASGGMMGQAYFRELKLLQQKTDSINVDRACYRQNIAKDLLNANSLATVVNDLLIPWQQVKIGNKKYRKDRGYLWEKQLNENTGNVLDKTLADYYTDELNANIPMMVFSPTIIDDGRRLNISSLPVTYLCKPSQQNYQTDIYRVDGIDAQHFFSNQNASDLKITSALRMNATFPFVMPNVFLPTSPQVQVMDAGLRDNFGYETSNRFLFVFQKWIQENTSGVVIIQMRDAPKNYWPSISNHQSMIDKFSDPINSIYNNWSDYQDFYFDNSISQTKSWLQIPFHVIDFDYCSKSDESASMSWHLTNLEKNDLLFAFSNTSNQIELEKILSIFKK